MFCHVLLDKLVSWLSHTLKHLFEALYFSECVHASTSPRNPFRFETINAELIFFPPLCCELYSLRVQTRSWKSVNEKSTAWVTIYLVIGRIIHIESW